MRSVGVCEAYPSFDKPFLKVYADKRRYDAANLRVYLRFECYKFGGKLKVKSPRRTQRTQSVAAMFFELSNSGGALADYQVLVTLTSSNFPTNAQASGAELSYWIESWDYAGRSAKLWVKVASIPACRNTEQPKFIYKEGIA